MYIGLLKKQKQNQEKKKTYKKQYKNLIPEAQGNPRSCPLRPVPFVIPSLLHNAPYDVLTKLPFCTGA